MEDKGYVWRMWKNFAESPNVFRERPDLDRAEVVEYRQGMATQFLPRRIWRGVWPVDSTPYAYVTYKAKCFSDDHRWTCKSTHSHLREIVSSASDPTRSWLSTVARCIRALHKAKATQPNRSFCLWNQSRVPEEFISKARHLKRHWSKPGECQTCGEEFTAIQMVKADATAFFKLVSRKRCLEEIRDAIECLRTAGAAGFLLHREDKTKSVVYWGRKAIPRTHRLVDFQEVLQILSFIDSDRFFTLGTSIFERIDGLAMGNATSPAITAFDLDTNATNRY